MFWRKIDDALGIHVLITGTKRVASSEAARHPPGRPSKLVFLQRRVATGFRRHPREIRASATSARSTGIASPYRIQSVAQSFSTKRKRIQRGESFAASPLRARVHASTSPFAYLVIFLKHALRLLKLRRRKRQHRIFMFTHLLQLFRVLLHLFE